MQRYFVSIEEYKSNVLTSDYNHISKVLRSRVGDQFIVCSTSCKKVEITNIDSETVQVKDISLIEDNNELPLNITIAQGLPKQDKMDYVVQKATELGMYSLIPLSMSRSVVKYDDKKSKTKVDRWNKIAKEAAEQSHRSVVPEVKDITSIKAIDYSQFDLLLLAYEDINNVSKTLKQTQFKQYKNILIVIGPEGGIDSKELEYLVSKNFITVSLGKRILRSETASLYALSSISYELEG